MKKQNGDALALGTRRAVFAVAVSLYAAMAGAQTNPAASAAPSVNSNKMMLAQALPADCLDSLGCKREIGSLVMPGGSGIAAAAGGSVSATGSGGNGPSSVGATGAGNSGANGGANSGSSGLGSGSTGSGGGGTGTG